MNLDPDPRYVQGDEMKLVLHLPENASREYVDGFRHGWASRGGPYDDFEVDEPDTWHRKDTAYLVSVVLLLAVSLAIGLMRWKA